MSVVIGEVIDVCNLNGDFDDDASISSYEGEIEDSEDGGTYSEEETENSKDVKPSLSRDEKIYITENLFGTNYHPLCYYRRYDYELESKDDFLNDDDFNHEEIEELLKYKPERDTGTDDQYISFVRQRVKNLLEGDYVEALKGRFQETCQTQPVALNLEILNHIMIEDFTIIIEGIISVEDILLYIQKCPEQMFDRWFSGFRKTMQVIMRNAFILENRDRVHILHFLGKYKTIIEQLELSATSHFMLILLTCIPKFETDDDAIFFEKILRIFREIYLEYMHKSPIIKGITSIAMTDVLHKVLKNTKAGISVQHCVMEILSIICSNSTSAASNLVGPRNNIHHTLIHLDNQYKFKGNQDASRHPHLVWSLLPALPRGLYRYNINDAVREVTISDSIMKMAVWQIEVERGIWVPFIPRLNYLIEQSYIKKKEKFTCYDYDLLVTVDLTEMLVIDESTLKKTPISRKEVVTFYRPLYLKKTIENVGFYPLNEVFARFAYKFLTRRFPLSLYGQEKYYCMEALVTILELMGPEQHKKLLFCAKPEKYVWRAGQLVKIMMTLLEQHPMYCQMFAIQTISLLYCNLNYLYRKIYDVYGIGRLFQKLLEMNKQETGSVEFITWKKEQITEFTICYNLGNKKFPDYTGVMETKQELEYYKESFFDENKSDILKRRSEAMKYFISYLTGPNSRDDRIRRMREFLFVFADIPEQAQCQVFDVHNNQILTKLVKEIRYFLIDDDDGYIQDRPLLYRKCFNTFGKIGTRYFQIKIENNRFNEVITLNARAFTTIQYIEHFIFSRIDEQIFSGRSKDPNVRFATKFALSFNGILLSPQMTLYEVITGYGVVDNELDAFDQIFTFVYQQNEEPFPSNEENNAELNEEYFKPTYALERYLEPRCSECEELTEDVKNALHLTNILYGINKHWTSAYEKVIHQKCLIDPQVFVNEPLTHCVFERLLDPFAALTGKYPPWIKYMFDNCPFIFTIRLRKIAFRLLYLDRIRALNSTKTRDSSYNEVNIIDYNHLPLTVGRSDMVNVVKEHLLHTSPNSIWSVVFRNEIGEGPGLKKELFNSLGKELQKDEYNIWASDGETPTGFVRFNEGLYPKFDTYSDLDFYGNSSSNVADTFITIGAIMAKALMEDISFPLPLATPLFKWLLNKQCLLSVDDLKYVNPGVHKVLIGIEGLIAERDKILAINELTPSNKISLTDDFTINGDSLESYNLDFVLPGHDGLELIDNGANTPVNAMNAHLYVENIRRALLFTGVQKQMIALKRGFNHIVKLSNLHMFEPEELQNMILGEEDDTSYWSLDNLIRNVELNNCSIEDDEIQNLFDILSSAKKETRRNFLEFVTGCSRLPIGGFERLTPRLNISIYDLYASTCFNQLSLRKGMDRSELKDFIEKIIPEGLNYFGNP